MKNKKTLADRTRLSAPKKLSFEEQEAALKKVSESSVSSKRRVNRVTVDFPNSIYETMKAHTKENGQTIKGYIVALVKRDLR